MSKVEAILSQLKEVAANPKKAMDDFKAETEICIRDRGFTGDFVPFLKKRYRKNFQYIII